MRKFQISLFGKLSINYDSKPMSGFESAKVQELLCFLLLHSGRPHPRASVASILWGDSCTTSNSRKYLRNALWRLRSAIPAEPELADMLVTDDDWIEVRPSNKLWLDVAELEQAFDITQKLDTPGLEPYVPAIEHAISLYTGSLLANWEHDWCMAPRDRLHHHYLTMVDKLAEYHEFSGQYDNVLRLAEQLLDSDPAHERTHRRLMRVYLKIGDRTNALRQYARCVETLQEELGLRPGPRTLAVLDEICGDRSPIPSRSDRPVTPPEIRSSPKRAAS